MSEPRKLTNRQVGELAEIEFRRICAEENLYCNKFDQDFTGKDYIVEFSDDAFTNGASIDDRKIPEACFFQVKGTRTSRISAKLSTIEYLAKSTNPCFIFAVQFNSLGQLVTCYLKHIDEQEIVRILKALRKSERDGAKPSERTISFGLSDDDSIDIGEVSLADEILSALSEFGDSYASQKEMVVRSSGYDPDRTFVGKLTIQAENEVEIMEGLLGLRQLQAKSLSVSKLRFGIALPDKSFAIDDADADTRISIKPLSGQPASLMVFGNENDLLPEFEVQLELISAPVKAPSPGTQLVLLKNDFIQVVIRGLIKKADCDFQFRLDAQKKYRLGAIDENCRMIAALASGEGKVELALDGKPVASLGAPFNVRSDNAPDQYLTACLKALLELEKIARQEIFKSISIKDIAHIPTDFMDFLIAAVTDSSVVSGTMKMQLIQQTVIAQTDQLLVVSTLEVSDYTCAVAVIYDITELRQSGDELEVAFTMSRICTIEELSEFDPDVVQDFAERVARIAGIPLIISVTSPNSIGIGPSL